MFKRALFLLTLICMCPACSTMRYTDPNELSEAVSDPNTEDIDIKPVSTFVPIEAKEIPVFTDPLTGLPTKETVVNCRPVAVVINNHHKALPQSGIGQAAIYYEVLAEGNITRIVAIFHDFNTQKIGPVRSARPYFLDFAMEYDAIFVHHGGSPQAYDTIQETGIADLDGMILSGTFWRDPDRVKIPGMFEHSSFTGEALIRQAQEQFEFRPVIHEGLNPGFLFYDEPTYPASAADAALISVPFADEYGAVFEFRNGLYYKSIEDVPQIDSETDEQLSVTNILIQFVPVTLIPGDTAGRRDVNLIGDGDGLLITKGGSVPIKWSKESHDTPTSWYNEDGGDLYLNKGKTWICVVSPGTAVSIE